MDAHQAFNRQAALGGSAKHQILKMQASNVMKELINRQKLSKTQKKRLEAYQPGDHMKVNEGPNGSYMSERPYRFSELQIKPRAQASVDQPDSPSQFLDSPKIMSQTYSMLE